MNFIKICVVYINVSMFRAFFDLNPCLWPYDVKGVDNRLKNFGLPKIYNELIESNIDANCWLFFVHEDFEIKESLLKINNLDVNCIYGTFGVRLENGVPIGYGSHVCSNKDGSNAVRVGLVVDSPMEVDSLDCQSVLVHASLLKKHPVLRFDENLSFDLYAEEFCMKARFELEIDVKVFDLDFQHYSHGNITDRYHQGLVYLAGRYPDRAVAGSCSFIGGRAAGLEGKFECKTGAKE